jgi:hypothetical protein
MSRLPTSTPRRAGGNAMRMSVRAEPKETRIGMESRECRATHDPVITTLGTGDSQLRAGCHRYDDDRRVWSALRYVDSVDASRLIEAQVVAAARPAGVNRNAWGRWLVAPLRGRSDSSDEQSSAPVQLSRTTIRATVVELRRFRGAAIC